MNNLNQWFEGPEELKSLARDFYINLYTAESIKESTILYSNFPHISLVDIRALNHTMSKSEVKIAMFQMAPNEALGPDGLQQASSKRIGILLGKMLWSL